MRIGIVTEGESEYDTLADLFHRINPSHFIVGSTLTKAQPTAPLPVIARELKRDIRVLSAEKVDLIVILLDRERLDDCPGDHAAKIRQQVLGDCVAGDITVEVIIKNSKFENWLISDLNALRAHPTLFTVSRASVNAVEPNKADNIDAEAILKRCLRVPYRKRKHAGVILPMADPLCMALHSRSFRRLMRVLGHHAYRGRSSRLPAPHPAPHA